MLKKMLLRFGILYQLGLNFSVQENIHKTADNDWAQVEL